MKKSTLVIYACVAVGVAAVLIFQDSPKSGRAVVDVKIPVLNAGELQGQKLFDINCAVCHGKNAAGTDIGPTFIHNIYGPGHHGDGAFFIATSKGVSAHHWKFGKMPPVTGVDKQEVDLIVQYIRALQRANGIK